MDDLRSTWRQWRQTPLVTTLAALSLTLGIGGNLALFSLVDALVLRTLPIAAPETLVRFVATDFRPGEIRDIGVPTHVWEHIRDHQTIFASVLAVAVDRVNLARGGEAQYVGCAFVDPHYFNTLGVAMALGRPLASSDNQPGSSTVAVISDALRQRLFGTANPVGQTISLNSHRFVIVGVAPREFFGLEVGRRDDVAVPLAAESIIRAGNSQLRAPQSSWLQLYARLKDPSQLESARTALRAWHPQLRQATLAPGVTPDRHLPYTFDLASAARGRSAVRMQYGDAVTLLLAAVGLLLLVASTNLAVLALARFSDRRHEIGVRLSLGASRLRVARLLLTDTVMMTTLCTVAGLWLAHTLARLTEPFLSITRFSAVPTDLALSIDGRMIGAVITVATVTLCIVGLMPAWSSTRITPFAALNQPRGASERAGGFRMMRVLAASQIAVSVVLVVGAVLLVRSFLQLTSRPTGIDQHAVLVAVVSDPLPVNSVASAVPRLERVRAAIAAVPGVEAVSAAMITPLSGLMAAAEVTVPGSPAPPIAGFLPFNSVLPGYFDALGTPILIGRDFNAMDVGGDHRVAIVNQVFAQQHFGGYNPIGRVLMVANRPVEIVGVVANTRAMTLREERDVAMVYAPIAQRTSLPNLNLRWVVRSREPERVRFGISVALRSVDPLISAEFRTMNDEALNSISRERLLAWVGGSFAALALLLAVVGAYGTFAYAVARRRREIGVRLALGATRGDIVRFVARDAVIMIGVGATLGLGAALAGTRALAGLLFELSPRDSQSVLLALSTTMLAAALATYVPARRAAAIDPAETLRE